ncbi:MAG: WG repeat-containing protein [Ruminococcaceae bacterium]|nr:WG repeat-containing protein [Oscillospiraceae bacterium]
MNSKKRNLIQLIGFIVCVAISVTTVICSSSAVSEKPASDPENTAADPLDPYESVYYEPADDVNINGNEGRRVPYTNYIYAEETAKFSTLEAESKNGYKLTSADYDDTCKIVIAKSTQEYSKAYSEAAQKVQKVVTEAGAKGGYISKKVTETEDAPLFRPYYGYIIYTAKGKVQLLDSKGKVLLSSFSGYSPVYSLTLSGEPLFEKGGKYYYYYDSSVKGAVFYDEITEDTFDGLDQKEPGSFWHFMYDSYISENYLMQEKGGEAPVTDISKTKPEGAGMVEYSVDSSAIRGSQTTAYEYKKPKSGLYPFFTNIYAPDFTIERTLWGYMNEKGDTVIEPAFGAAFEFSDDGYAVVLDIHGHLCTIDTKGRVVYNPYDNVLYIPEMGNKKIRDIYTLPDTFGVENTGMFTLDHGYTMMRRQLVDTEGGYMIKRETKVLVNAEGKYLNYPSDYNLIAYSDGMLLLEKEGIYGYMNYLGEWVIEPIYRYAEPFSEGLAVVGYRPDKLGMIDTKGNTVLPLMYTKLFASSGGVITAFEAENGWTLFNKVSTAAQDTDFSSPVLEMKHRAIALAKKNFAVRQEEKKKQEEANETVTE